MATERAYWLAWSQIKGVGPVTIKHLWEHFASLEEAWNASPASLIEVDGIGLLSSDNIAAQRPKINPDNLLSKHESANRSFWTPADADYPALLFAINDPPPVLYYRGTLRLNQIDSLPVGIVGTRQPSSYGRRWTQRLSQRLAKEGAVIVSGLAAGIDTIAHESCLRESGLTVAVLGTGVDQVYPAKNKRLQAEIEQAGLVLSEYPDGTGPDKKHFPQRNRIIAGLSRAILVTEAPAKSGALITSRLANDYCREVYTLPCGLDNSQGLGNLSLMTQGAQLILGEQPLVEALVELPPITISHSTSPSSISTYPTPSSPSPSSRRILSHPEIDAPGNNKHNPTEHNPTEHKQDKYKHKQDNHKQDMAVDPAETATTCPPDFCLPDLSPTLLQVLSAVPIEPTVLDNIVQIAQIETGQVLGALVQLELLGLVTQLPGMQYQRG